MNADVASIRGCLDSAYDRFVEHDLHMKTSVLGAVIEYCARSPDLADKELWALFCATVDFQISVTRRLLPMLRGLVFELSSRELPFRDLVEDASLAEDVLTSFEWSGGRGFQHRLLKVGHLLCFFDSLSSLLGEYEKLGDFVRERYESAPAGENPVAYAIKSLLLELRKGPCPGYCKGYKPRNKENCKYIGLFAPNPRGGSALKRLCLFFRWMARPYPDLRLWKFVDPSNLLISLDKGVARVIGRAFGNLLGFKVSENWRSVLRVSDFMREINPEDPAKYDYVLSRPAIMGYCRPKDPRCYCCPLFEVCDYARRRPLPPPRRGPLMSEKEDRIFRAFWKRYAGELGLDDFDTERPVDGRKIDVVAHEKGCRSWVIEVEEALNYDAIGQVVVYRWLFGKKEGKTPKAAIVCEKAKPEDVEACEVDTGIRVFVV